MSFKPSIGVIFKFVKFSIKSVTYWSRERVLHCSDKRPLDNVDLTVVLYLSVLCGFHFRGCRDSTRDDGWVGKRYMPLFPSIQYPYTHGWNSSVQQLVQMTMLTRTLLIFVEEFEFHDHCSNRKNTVFVECLCTVTQLKVSSCQVSRQDGWLMVLQAVIMDSNPDEKE